MHWYSTSNTWKLGLGWRENGHSRNTGMYLLIDSHTDRSGLVRYLEWVRKADVEADVAGSGEV